MRRLLEDATAVGEARQYGGVTMVIRKDSNDDLVCRNVLGGGEYKKINPLQPTDRWLDIGGHIGSFSRWIAPGVKSVLAYEPDPYNAQLFRLNTAAISNVVLIEKAVWTERGSRTLYKNTFGGKDMHSLYPRKGRDELSIETEAIEAALRESEANKVKLDAEGVEYDLFRYLDANHRDLFRSIEEWVFEYHFRPLGDSKVVERYRELLGLLGESGYRLTAIPPERIKRHWHAVVYAKRRAIL